ncbi:RNA-directed DNA polymerase from mobile element jockey [Elysia marginata]|uniref:RNA-directed DNA polymerase from mobile element jockey n=1 Tax=Elysia marginata TaxID=1093978 RepID=A0AAV4GDU3_9GAST|nr:RNA-directed DNA polymerase from mobile element jockey [Elysia marginata]
MFKWIEQYLQNYKARAKTQHFKSRTQNMKHGVPQGGILSPTLFSMFMNDIQTILPKVVYGAMYADDMAIWATEEYTGTAHSRLQLTLDALRMWTEKWLMKKILRKPTSQLSHYQPNSKQYALRLENTSCEKSHPQPTVE